MSSVAYLIGPLKAGKFGLQGCTLDLVTNTLLTHARGSHCNVALRTLTYFRQLASLILYLQLQVMTS